MKPDQWQEFDRLFNAALARPPEARTAFLEAACIGKDALRHDVQVLLAAHDDAHTFIERPAIEVAVQQLAMDQACNDDTQPHNLQPEESFSHYRIIAPLGAGGMGLVYLAQDTTLGRKVALKLLPDEFTRDRDRLRRFQQEAHAASALNHPNIITIYEIGQVGERHFIASEFIEGETLRQHLTNTHSSRSQSNQFANLDEILHLALQICDALSAAHEVGIVHRDVKPENIMVRRDGYVKVLDFGLAKLTIDHSVVDANAPTKTQMTHAGVIMGTTNYMSPEQARGQPVDARSDIFSLGVVLYELLTGSRPFEGETTSDVIAAILTKEPYPIRHYSAELPEAIEHVVTKALTKNRDRRYQTTREMQEDLRRVKQRLDLAELEHSELTDVIRSGKRSHRASALGLIAATLILVLAALGYVFFSARSPVPGEQSQQSTRQLIDSIAVLPLVNTSNDPETEYLSDGITESLINSLSQVQQLRVVARMTAFRFKGKDIDPQQVGRELGVGVLLTGRFIQKGDKLNIQVDLVDTGKGAQVWGQQYDRNASDLLALKQELARQISEILRPGWGTEYEKRLTRGDTINNDAYQFYLRGRQFLNKGTVEGFKRAIREFEQAIEKDQNYARAWAGLAETYDLLEVAGGTPTSETLPKGRTAAERALQIDDSLTEAHTSLAIIEQHSWNFTAAEREFKRAIELDPNNPRARQFYGFYLGWVRGRFDRAIAELRQAQQFDPVSPSIGNNVAQVYVAKGDLDEAIKQEKKVLELDPYPQAHRILGLVYRKQGRYTEAFAELEKGIELSGRESRFLADLGVCYAVAGQRDKARGVLKELEEQYDRRKTLAQHVADVYAALGEKEQAFAWLEKDFQTRSGALSMIAYAPRSDVLRAALSSDPRWNDLLRRIGLPQN